MPVSLATTVMAPGGYDRLREEGGSERKRQGVRERGRSRRKQEEEALKKRKGRAKTRGEIMVDKEEEET